MTETHLYQDVLPRLHELEPRAMPIKHVGLNKALATGYKIPSDTSSLDGILKILRETTL